MFLTIVLPEVFVMAHIECCRETGTAIFAARTNLPVLDFQTWQVCCVCVCIDYIKHNDDRLANRLRYAILIDMPPKDNAIIKNKSLRL